VFDAYAEVYQALEPSSIDIGPGSNVRIARAAFPAAEIAVWLDVGLLPRMSADQMAAWVARVIEDGGPAELIGWIGVAEVGVDVVDQTVRDWVTVGQRLRL
jgi:hypothetical protein